MVRISRVSRSGDKVILKSSTGYGIFSKDSSEVVSGEFSSLVASGSWRRPFEGDAEAFANLLEIADGSIVASAPVQEKRARKYRAPKAVREEISLALKEFSAIISDSDREIAKRISQGPVEKDDIEWMYTFFSQIDKAEKLRGGKYGRRWAEKVCAVKDPITASVPAFADDDLFYYGISNNEEATHLSHLMAVDPKTNELYDWMDGKFELAFGETISDVDEPYILPLDGETAAQLATWINYGTDLRGFDAYNANFEERNLYELAASELDFEELDRTAAIIADGIGYSAPERSVNAKRQNRGPGGKFGGGGGGETGANPPSKTLTAFNKARLPEELPLVENVADRINEWLASAVTAAAATTNEAMYFAVVDEVDKTAVMDAVAIRKSADNVPEAYLRKGGEWVKDDDMLANLRGSTPPPVVEIDDTETVKTVLAQIDEHDNTATDEVADDVSSSEQIQALSVGFELPDGSFSIKTVSDLEDTLTVFSFVEPTENEITHVRKRAAALNRLDLIPSEWRTLSIAQRGITAAAQSPLMGEYGELLAAGVPGVADTPSDFAAAMRLQNYWTRGRGAAKIRWGTPGDLTRAHRHLAKYVGDGRAWGLAQNYHKSLFNVSNTTHDKATGQYRSRGKR